MLVKKLWAVFAILCLSLCAMAQEAAPSVTTEPATFDERLGEDDGAALAILFGGNLRGNLELCD